MKGPFAVIWTFPEFDGVQGMLVEEASKVF